MTITAHRLSPSFISSLTVVSKSQHLGFRIRSRRVQSTITTNYKQTRRRPWRFSTTTTCCYSNDLISEIQSTKNERVKETRTLLQRKHRERKDLILLEGQRLVSEAINNDLQIEQLFYTREILSKNEQMLDIQNKANKKRIKQYIVTDSIIDSLSDTKTPQGIIAVCKKPNKQLLYENNINNGTGINPFLLICDGIKDPGNLGTLLRSAVASNIDIIITTSNTVDLWSLKTLRSGMGAHFHLPIIQTNMTWDEINDYLNKFNINLYISTVSSIHENIPYYDINWTLPSAIVIGSESQGVSEEVFQYKHKPVFIPMKENIESLNAAMAGTIILFEAKRQREIQ